MASDPSIPTDAASLVVLRGSVDTPEVLLGRRRDTARFMPGVFVFPGGAVDPQDIVLGNDNGWAGTRYHAAAIRETWEETSIEIARSGPLPADAALTSDPFYAALAAAGRAPDAGALFYIARAITPPVSPIRFDTRFFLTEEAKTAGIAHAVGELPEVRWVPVPQALASDHVRGVTKFVLGEAVRLRRNPETLADPDRQVRVYRNLGDSAAIGREPQADGLS